MTNHEVGHQSDDFFIENDLSLENDRTDFPLKPIVIGLGEAYEKEYIKFDRNGGKITALFTHPDLEKRIKESSIQLGEDRLWLSGVQWVFEDLQQPFSSLAKAGFIDGEPLYDWYITKRTEYDSEKKKQTQENSPYEPAYGSFVFDPVLHRAGIFPPKELLKLGLQASNGDIIHHPLGLLSWDLVNKHLANTTIGYGGASVGGNNFRADFVHRCPEYGKIADGDYWSIQNFNRVIGVNFFDYTHNEALSKVLGTDRVSKAQYHAHEALLLYPYSTLYVYSEDLHEGNLEQFLFGSENEKVCHFFNEEVHDILFKYESRKQIVDAVGSRRIDKMGIVTASDFGKTAHLAKEFYSPNNLQISKFVSNETLAALYETAKYGGLEDAFRLAGALYGVMFGLSGGDAVDENMEGVVVLSKTEQEFCNWVNRRSKVPTASIPQIGPTAYKSAGETATALAEESFQFIPTNNSDIDGREA